MGNSLPHSSLIDRDDVQDAMDRYPSCYHPPSTEIWLGPVSAFVTDILYEVAFRSKVWSGPANKPAMIVGANLGFDLPPPGEGRPGSPQPRVPRRHRAAATAQPGGTRRRRHRGRTRGLAGRRVAEARRYMGPQILAACRNVGKENDTDETGVTIEAIAA
jgi:hypothetical protein